jgi:hypothetical protein
MLQEMAGNTGGVAAMLRISIQEVPISNLIRDTPTFLVGFAWFSSGRCWDITLIRSELH